MNHDLTDDSPKDECGVLGVYAPEQEAGRIAFFGLHALQHRGQESAGIAVSDGCYVRMHKDMGLISQVFKEETLKELVGHLAVGHTRYSTTGASVLRNAQPVYCQSLVGEIAVAHNGNLINAKELRQEMELEGEVFSSTSDSEVLARILVHALDKGPEFAVREVMKRARGAYSVVVLTPKLILGFRDPSGIRPLSTGFLPGGGFIVASETCAFGPVGGTVDREVQPGEAVCIDETGMRYFQGHEQEPGGMCLFEFIYFARPDSVMYNRNLYTARERMGENLAFEHPAQADIVVPVPDSGIRRHWDIRNRAEFRSGKE